MKKYFKFILIVSLVFFIGFTVFAQAEESQNNSTTETASTQQTTQYSQQGLVPCGPKSLGFQYKCDVCGLFKLVDNIMDLFVKGIMPVLATLMVIIGAIVLMSAGGSETQLSKGKDIIKAAIIGIVIILSSWLIIDSLMSGFSVVGEYGGSFSAPWNKIQCTQTLNP